MGAILVVRNGKTEKDMLAPAIEAIGPRFWGVVANDSRSLALSYQEQRKVKTNISSI